MTDMVRIQAIDRNGQLHRLEAPVGTVMMELLRDANLGVEAVCGGCCACATCHVFVPETLRGEPGEIEVALLGASERFDNQRSRLSCQVELRLELDNLQVRVAPED